jgi:hypothetical protein
MNRSYLIAGIVDFAGFAGCGYSAHFFLRGEWGAGVACLLLGFSLGANAAFVRHFPWRGR